MGTSDIEAYVERAQGAGGQASMGIMDVPYTGKVSHVVDPAGAALTPFQVADPERTSWGHSSESGHFCWVELLSQDANKARDFYSKVVGWELLDMLIDTQGAVLGIYESLGSTSGSTV